MACLAKNIVEYPEFKELVQKSGYTEDTVFGIMSSWLDGDPEVRNGKFPTLKELTQYYDNKRFFTDNKDLIEEYKKPFISERFFSRADSPENIQEHIKRMVTIFGSNNVFIVSNQSGETTVKVARPVEIKDTDIKEAKDLLLNGIEFAQGVIDKIQDKIKWKRATEQDLKDLKEFKQQLSEKQALYNGLKDGTSEVYLNEYGHSQVRKKSAIPKQEPTQKKNGPVVLLPATQQDSQYFNTPSNSSVSVSYEDKAWKEPFKFYSGGEPNGADTAWGNAARQLGIEVKDFTIDDYDALPETEKAKIEKEYSEVVEIIGRKKLPANTYKGQLVRRDMLQADNADAVFAVGSFDESFIEGGTAYAAMRGIILGIPVHFFNQDNGIWYVYDSKTKSFQPESAPLLTQHAAVIGTSELNGLGSREIINTLQRTGRHFGFISEVSPNDEIKLTDEQQNVVDYAVEFIESKLRTGNTPSGKKFLTIQGMAGTGKTTIVRNIIQKLRDDNIYGDIAVSALSRKAVHVLSSKLKDLGVATETLYTLAGAKVNESEKQFDIDPKKEKFSRYSIVFVDEASMVGEGVMDAISAYVEQNPSTVIVFLGDYGQVRPISESNESVKSGVFHRNDMQIETLTERIRQGEGSPILGYADKFYAVSVGKSNSLLLSKPKTDIAKSVTNDSGALIFAGNIGNVFTRIVDAFKKAVREKNPNYIKIVSSTNQNVDTLNQKIHKAIFPDSKLDIDAGDLIIFNSPYVKLEIENATEGVVESVGSVKTDRYGIQYQEYNVTLSDGRSLSVDRLVQTEDNIDLYNKKANELKNKAKSTKDKSDWREYYAHIGNNADLALGYAMTIHKAQGSTYDMVVVDEQGIRKDGAWQNQERAEIVVQSLLLNLMKRLKGQKVGEVNKKKIVEYL